MKPGEYAVLTFVLLMLTAFFSIFIWFQIKRIKRNLSNRQKELNER
jgi:preprotein translocase subunit YajC